jgi:hypothetical protein
MTKRNVLPTPNVDAISTCSPLFRKFIAGFVFDVSLTSATRLTINAHFENSRNVEVPLSLSLWD